jgi:hypothetical protein
MTERDDKAGTGEGTDGPVATAARYQASSGRVIVELSNGAMIAFPAGLVQGLEGAEADALGAVEVVDGGHVLRWAGLDVYLSLLAVLTDILGARALIKRLAEPAMRRAERRGEEDGRGKPRRR